MNVLMPFVGDSVGGSHRSCLELRNGLVDNNITVIILLHDKTGPLASLLDNYKIPYKCLPVSKLAGETPNVFSVVVDIARNYLLFSKFLRDHKVDVVHGNDIRINLSWFLPVKFSRAAFIWHQRVVLSSSWLWCALPYMCDHFISISKLVLNSSPETLNSERRSLVLNPFNIESFFEYDESRQCLIDDYKIPENCFLMGYIGRLVEYKRIDFALEGFKQLQDSLKSVNVHFIIVGSGAVSYQEKLRGFVEKMGLQSNVTFLGFSDNPLRVISAIDLLIAPSCVDAFGRTLVEAMLQKTAVLAADSGGHSEIIIDENTGFLYKPNDLDSFFSKAKSLIENDALRNSITQTAYNNAKKKFSTKKHTRSVIQIYEKTLKK